MSCSDNDGCEIERDLRARLADAEADRDHYEMEARGWEARGREAEARLAAVEALHADHGRLFPGQCWCLGCQMAAAARGEGDRG